MSDSSNELTVPKPDAGMAFRMEMWATNALLGYWWVLVGIIVAVLLGVAIYGFVDSTATSAQRKGSQQAEAVLAQVQNKLLDQEQILSMEQAPGPNGKMMRVAQIEVSPSFAGQTAPGVSMIPLAMALDRFPKEGVEQGPVLTEAGDALMAVYNGHSGVAAHQAALYAAEMYALAGDAESERKALDAAAGSSAKPIRYAAQSRIAMNAVDAGDAETLEAMLRPWIKEENGYFGQQAAYDLGRAYEAMDRDGDAEAAYRELLNTWSVTPFRDMVDLRLTEMGVDTVPMEITLEQDGVAPEDSAPDGEGEGQGSGEGEGAGE